MPYHIPIIETVELASGRRLDDPLFQIPLVYRARQLAVPAWYEKSRYMFELDRDMAEMMETSVITGKFAYDIWHEPDRSRPNCRIVAIVFEDRR
jgi:hypothetical protein